MLSSKTIVANGNRVQQWLVTIRTSFRASLAVKCGGFIRAADSGSANKSWQFCQVLQFVSPVLRCEKIFIFLRHPVHKSSELWVSNCFFGVLVLDLCDCFP